MQNEWISVKDRLPEDYRQKYIVCIKSNDTDYCWIDTLYFNIHENEWIYNKASDHWYYQVTHWMPLPKLPKGE